MEKSNTRSSILKKPVTEDSSFTFTRSNRRISFSDKKNVKVFAPGDAGATIWLKSYEESAEVTSANSTKGTLYRGPLVIPELVMKLRNNKIISRLPQKVPSKAKIPKGVENVPPPNTLNVEEEQLSEGIDISLSVSAMQQLLKVEERFPLRLITQQSKQIEEAGSHVSPQASLTFQSPEKIYCSFAVTNNDIRALSKFNNGKKLDLTLADIIRDYDKQVLHKNQSDKLDLAQTMDTVNEGSVPSAHAMGNMSKPKRETMFNLENMELVSIQKTPSKRSTIYYYDNLELSLKDNEKQRIPFTSLKPFDRTYEIQEKSLVKDSDNENREIGVDNTVDSMKFDSEKNAEVACRMKRGSVYTRLDMDMEEDADRVYIKQVDLKTDVESCLKLKEQKVSNNSSNEQKMDSSISFTLQGRNDEEFMKWSPIPASACSSEEHLPKKNVILSAKRQTIYDQCDLDISVQDETAKIAELGHSVPVDDYDSINCNSMSLTLLNFDLTTQNDLKDSKNGEINNEQTVDMINTITSVKNNIEPHIEPFKCSEKSSYLPINSKNTPMRDDSMKFDSQTNPEMACRMKRGSVYTGLDMDMEEDSDRVYIKQADLKTDVESCLKLKEQKVSNNSSNEQQMDSSISFTLQGRNDEEFMKWSPIPASAYSSEEPHPKKNVILSAKRQTIYDQCDLDISVQDVTAKIAELDDSKNVIFSAKCPKKNEILSAKRQTIYDQCDLDISIQDETAKIAELDNSVPIDDYDGIKCNPMSFTPLNFDLTTQNDLKDSKNGEINNEQTVDMINTITSVKNNIEPHIEPFKCSEKSSYLPINTKNTPMRDDSMKVDSQTNPEMACRMKRGSVYNGLDMDLEEDADRVYIKQADLKKDVESCLKLKEQKVSNNISNEQQMDSSISFTQQGRNDGEFMEWSPIPASACSSEEHHPKKNVILSAKRQTIYDQCDLDISSVQDGTAKITESDDSVPVDDYDGIKCNLENNVENNTISSIKRRMSFTPLNLGLTIQNDLKDSKNGEINNEQTVDTINTITSVKNNIEPHIEPFKCSEKSSYLPINTKKTPKRDDCTHAKEPMTLILHKLQSSQNEALNIFNKSYTKNASNSIQTFNVSMKEGAKGTELENARNLKSIGSNIWLNSLKKIDLSGCEQLDQTSEIIFCDLSSTNGTIEQLRNAAIVIETSPEIPRLSRASSCHTNTTISTFSANTTQALCNFDLSKITKKGNLRTTSDFKCKDKCKDTSFDYKPPIPPSVSKGDEIQEINLSINNLNLNCTSKDVNLKNDNCENILQTQQTIETKSTIDKQKSFCSRCKVCDCKPKTKGSTSDDSTFSLKFEGPFQPRKIDFSGYEKFHNMPSIRDIVDAHKKRRETLNSESYEESVSCPTIPSLDFLLENYESQYKLQVKEELPIGAVLPLKPSLEILLSNKLQSEHFGWKLNTLCMPIGVMEFRHNIIPSVTLILKYSPNLFYSNEDKWTFDKVQLQISKLYGNNSALDRVIENEICVKAPYDLKNYCSSFNDLFSFLSFMNNICDKAVQLGKDLFRRVVGFNGSLQKDNSDVCFIKKRVLYTPKCNQNGLMSTQDFLVQVRNIESISHTDIMLPPLSDFKESICSIPEGLEFLTMFFFDPISYLKTEY